ncbi:attachment HN glycoprotein [Miniopterus schreibersii paramyxovirus]|uniref:attachment HN glycoprotein n=1 Tax=Miniopterus schreibersii paramyxovirus TaxID=1387879 RepID=UPI0003D8E41B|nr:attachment HN glycoprotein [Miniopterus schreibersii paramyxovirus]AGU69457.1 attachment HN glycoprotein [Miniopterus schreibersii paramyxovirus]
MDYFGDRQLAANVAKEHRDRVCSKIFIGISSIAGLISILALIALNVTNLAIILRNTKTDGSVDNQYSKLSDLINNVQNTLSSSVNPRISLINSATSLVIPGMIKETTKTLQYDIYKYCTFRPNDPQTPCTQPSPIGHSALFSQYDPNLLVSCNVRTVSPVKSMTPVVFDSFIPETTTLRGCTRIPSFALGEFIYSYTHNQIAVGCGDSSISNQDWLIGTIDRGYNNTPTFKTAQRWYFDDNLNRKSCSTAVSGRGAWILCSIVTMSEAMDYRTEGVMDIFIGYQDVYGRRQSWIITEGEINFSNTFIAFYPSVGSGVAFGGKVYFLIYGGLNDKIQGDARCPHQMCVGLSTDQSICNRAQAPGWSGNKQLVNAILSFDDQIEFQPNVTVNVIPVTDQIMGAEGRLYYAPYSRKAYIYVRSSSWYPLMQYGLIDLTGDLHITWMNYTTLSRPGVGACTAKNRCPAECVTGVYTDMFLLSTADGLAVSVELVGDTQRRGPTLKLVDLQKKYTQYILTTVTQSAAYTTTTCFLFDFKPWCVSVVEFSPASIGSMAPIPILFPIWDSCFSNSFELPYSEWEYPENPVI